MILVVGAEYFVHVVFSSEIGVDNVRGVCDTEFLTLRGVAL
jgi:hypothetical protein